MQSPLKFHFITNRHRADSSLTLRAHTMAPRPAPLQREQGVLFPANSTGALGAQRSCAWAPPIPLMQPPLPAGPAPPASSAAVKCERGPLEHTTLPPIPLSGLSQRRGLHTGAALYPLTCSDSSDLPSARTTDALPKVTDDPVTSLRKSQSSFSLTFSAALAALLLGLAAQTC